MQTKEILHTFYTAFSKGDATTMTSCYHDDIVFEDPAFGKLTGKRAVAMWEMLLSKKEESELSITFKVVDNKHAEWVANYKYGPQKRPVINKVKASFEFLDGKIIQHTDNFSLWKWSQQALGASGLVLGWSTFVKKKIREKTAGLLQIICLSKRTNLVKRLTNHSNKFQIELGYYALPLLC